MSHDNSTAQKISYELSQITKELEIVSILSKKIKQTQLNPIELRAAASSLQSIYNGLEKILVMILKDKMIPIPQSHAWHSDVLELCKDQEIISLALESELRDLMGFRNFVRHAYSFMLENDLIKPLLNNMVSLFDLFIKETQSRS